MAREREMGRLCVAPIWSISCSKINSYFLISRAVMARFHTLSDIRTCSRAKFWSKWSRIQTNKLQPCVFLFYFPASTPSPPSPPPAHLHPSVKITWLRAYCIILCGASVSNYNAALLHHAPTISNPKCIAIRKMKWMASHEQWLNKLPLRLYCWTRPHTNTHLSFCRQHKIRY